MIVGSASALALAFGVAVAGKLTAAGFGEFRRGVGRLWFGPGRLSPAARHVLAVGLLVGEIVTTAALIGGAVLALAAHPVWAVPGFVAAAVLLGAFAVAHAVVLAGGRSVPCACFGRTATTVSPVSLLRTLLLLALTVTGLAMAMTGTGGIDPAVALLAAPAGLVLGLLLVSLEDLVALFRSPAPVSRAGG